MIVSRVFGARYSSTITRLIGIAEIAMAIWIISGYFAQLSSALQIVLVLTMNVIEQKFARDLLLFGSMNFLFALAFCVFVLASAFVF